MSDGSVVPEAMMETYRRNGWVHLKGLLDPAEVAHYREAIDQAVARRKRHDTRPLAEKSSYEQSFLQCQYLWEDFPAVRPLTFHPAVVGAAAALIGAERVRLWHDQALYKEAGGRETEAHQDHPYWPLEPRDSTITAWIPLTPTDHRSGCMGYVSGSQNSEARYINIFSEPGAGKALEAEQPPATYAPAQPGDVLFHHGYTVHMAKANRSAETRRAYTAIYFRDGCTRAPKGAHPSVDRDQIAPGALIDGAAAPIAWPLPAGQFPEPAPWPDMGDSKLMQRAAKLGVFPAGVGE